MILTTHCNPDMVVKHEWAFEMKNFQSEPIWHEPGTHLAKLFICDGMNLNSKRVSALGTGQRRTGTVVPTGNGALSHLIFVDVFENGSIRFKKECHYAFKCVGQEPHTWESRHPPALTAFTLNIYFMGIWIFVS